MPPPEWVAVGRGENTPTIHAPNMVAARVRPSCPSVTLYDALSRVQRTIGNYVVQGSSAPGEWVWDSGAARWEDGANNAISFGTEQNENLLSDTRYNENVIKYGKGCDLLVHEVCAVRPELMKEAYIQRIVHHHTVPRGAGRADTTSLN